MPKWGLKRNDFPPTLMVRPFPAVAARVMRRFPATSQRGGVVDTDRVLTYLRGMTWDFETDAAGLLCPLPVLRARKRLLAMKPGQVLRVVATDPAAVIDIPHFCSQSGDTLLSSGQDGAAHVFLIRKGAA